MTYIRELLPKMIRYRLARAGRGSPGMPINLTFSVTNLCQSRCKTCRIWDLYRRDPARYRNELRLEEIRRIFRSMGHVYIFNVSGGEPFLRKDFPEIVAAADVLVGFKTYPHVDMFETGAQVHVTGTSKGKGFAGVMKRHNFGGGPGGHGSHFHRAPGSVGQASTPSRIFRGQRMAGHMGDETVTVRNLEVVKVDAEQNLLLVKGAVPGGKGALLKIRSS